MWNKQDNNKTDGALGQQPRHFYNPRYENAQSRKAPEPVRATLYWNPALAVESCGEAAFDFFTSDHKSDATIVVEGFTKDGIPISIKGIVKR